MDGGILGTLFALPQMPNLRRYASSSLDDAFEPQPQANHSCSLVMRDLLDTRDCRALQTTLCIHVSDILSAWHPRAVDHTYIVQQAPQADP
jgi:hypothetical protein